MKVEVTSEKTLLEILRMVEHYVEIIDSQDELLKKLSDKSTFWPRAYQAGEKLIKLHGAFLSVRK